jgi:hypothetical protein
LWSLEYLPADSTRGGIVIAWDTDLVAAGQPVRKDYSVTMELTMKLTNSTFLITAVYGQTEHSVKPDFLAELVSCQPAAAMPWLCLWDFNLIYAVHS